MEHELDLDRPPPFWTRLAERYQERLATAHISTPCPPPPPQSQLQFSLFSRVELSRRSVVDPENATPSLALSIYWGQCPFIQIDHYQYQLSRIRIQTVAWRASYRRLYRTYDDMHESLELGVYRRLEPYHPPSVPF